MELRAEVMEPGVDGIEAKTWREATWAWRDYIIENRETEIVFENGEGKRVKAGTSSRFDPDYSNKQYAKLKDLERALRADYGKRLHTAMLTLTASTTDQEGNPRPPVDHLDELLSSWSAVTRALRRVGEELGTRFERLAILEPHKSGYLHVHIAVFVDGVVVPEMFEPVIEAHLRNCETAGEDAHDVSDDSTISVKHAGRDRESGGLENLGTYLAEYLGCYGDDPLEASGHEQMANAVLWSTQRQRWRPSNGAQTYMAQRTGEDSEEWELVGLVDGDGELHEASGGGGAVRTLVTVRDSPPPDGDGGG